MPDVAGQSLQAAHINRSGNTVEDTTDLMRRRLFESLRSEDPTFTIAQALALRHASLPLRSIEIVFCNRRSLSTTCSHSAPLSSPSGLDNSYILLIMLRATEQLSWQSTLARFKRGYEDITNAADTSADGDNKDHVDWQLFSGKHLRCKVTFTKAIDKSRPSQASQSRTGSLTLEELADRQLRIIVECGPAGSDDSRKGGKGSKGMTALGSGSQPIPPLLLVRRHNLEPIIRTH